MSKVQEEIPIRVTVSFSFKEFLKWSYALSLREMGPWVLITIVSCLFLYFILDKTWPLIVIAAVLGLVLLLIFTIYQNTRKIFYGSPVLRAQRQYTFSWEKIEITGDSFDSTIAWDLLLKARETAGVFLLYTGPTVGYHLPLRCFENEDQVVEFRKLLREKLENKAKIKK